MRILKIIGIGLAGLILLVIVVVGVLHLVGSRRLAAGPAVQVRMIGIPSGEAALARGEYLANVTSGCTNCHGPNLSGKIFVNEPPIGLIPAPNLTSGQGGIGAAYTDEDWLRALRHGIGGDGRVLGTMPSHWFARMSDEDMAALVAYVKSVPPVDNVLPPRNITFPGTIIFGVLDYANLPVNLIDHSAVQAATSPVEEPTAAYGEYVATIGLCGECHGEKLAGRIDETGPPPGPNLTPAGNLASWTEADFFAAIRNGVTPEGHNLEPEEMPWPYYGNMNDTQLKALWAYLQSLPPRELAQNQ